MTAPIKSGAARPWLTIAAASGVSLSRLLAANGWSADHTATRGETVRIPHAGIARGGCRRRAGGRAAGSGGGGDAGRAA